MSHPKVTGIPIGLDYHTMSVNQSHDWGKQLSPLKQEKILMSIMSESKPFYERELKAYSNFHFLLNSQDRKDAIKKIPRELVYYEPNKINRLDSWKNQIKYAFVISPHGNGLDCHRTWEALCLGCIPIVKTSSIDYLFKDLPVLIVNEWSDVSLKKLSETVELFKTMNFNKNRLTLNYWVNIIKSHL